MNNDILLFSYWEHFKAAKDIALVYPVDHPKRVALEVELQKLSKMLHPEQETPPPGGTPRSRGGFTTSQEKDTF